MKRSKKSGGLPVAVVLAGGFAAASTTSAFAAPGGTPHTTPTAKDTEKKGTEKDAAKDATETADTDQADGVNGHSRFLSGGHGMRTVKDKSRETGIHEWQGGKGTPAPRPPLP